MHLVFFILAIYLISLFYSDIVNSGMFGTMFHIIALTKAMVLVAILVVGLTLRLGESFLSAFLLPFRYCFQLVSSRLVIPRETGTYFERLKDWLVLVKIATGLEDYQFELPPVRAAAQHNCANVGVYASVLQGGKVRRGDSVEPE
jgi:hypothetical protein